ncbi:hypothetical protein ERJ75_001315300 [Trypanosoma vivax]|nr:hypothetical protein ERJ75_001315300 [Trypanosoma vivax]
MRVNDRVKREFWQDAALGGDGEGQRRAAKERRASRGECVEAEAAARRESVRAEWCRSPVAGALARESF